MLTRSRLNLPEGEISLDLADRSLEQPPDVEPDGGTLSGELLKRYCRRSEVVTVLSLGSGLR